MKKLCPFPRFLAGFLALLLFLPTLSGCHRKLERQAFALPQTFDESRRYQISFWAKNDTNDAQVAIYKKAIADFQALYPNITVDLKLYNDYSKIYNDVITNISTDTTPNVCITYPDHIATYLTGENSVVPLASLMADPGYGLGGSLLRFDGPDAGQIVPKFLEECYVGDELYAIPYMRSTEACYINRDYVEALGYQIPDILTWDFIWEVSQAATAKNPDGTYKLNGQKAMIPFIYKSTDNMMITYLAQKNAPYTKSDGTVSLFNDTTADFLETVRTNTAAGAFSTFKISGYPANYLNTGQCIFAIDSTAGATWVGYNAPLVDVPEDRLLQFETVVRAVPQVDPTHMRMISQGPSICIFNKEDPQVVLASWLFAQFMLTNDVQIAYSQTEGYLPVTTKAQQDPAYQDYLSRAGEDNELYYRVKLEAVKLLMDNIENTFVTPVFNGSASVRDAAGHLIESVTKNTRRKKPVDIDALYAETIALKRLDQISVTESGGTLPPLEGPLPAGSVALLVTLGLVWLTLLAGFLWDKQKKRRAAKEKRD